MNGIYHPSYSGCNLTTNNMSIGKFTEWLAESLVNDKSIIIIGDFNIHINKRGENKDTAIFMNTIEALGFQQHVNFSTHRIGNTLDLVLTESQSPSKLKQCFQVTIYQAIALSTVPSAWENDP